MFNFGLENWANILLSVGIWVVAFLFAVFMFNFGCILFFNSTLKKHSKGMTVALNSKFDNIKKLYKITSKLGVKFDEKFISCLESIDPDTFKKQTSSECKSSREKLTYLRDELLYISRRNDKLEKNNEFNSAKNNVLEMDTVYRTTVANYNADVLGFNYWIRFLPFRWFWKLCRTKTKDLI